MLYSFFIRETLKIVSDYIMHGWTGSQRDVVYFGCPIYSDLVYFLGHTKIFYFILSAMFLILSVNNTIGNDKKTHSSYTVLEPRLITSSFLHFYRRMSDRLERKVQNAGAGHLMCTMCAWRPSNID
jgi:hypothetical protein